MGGDEKNQTLLKYIYSIAPWGEVAEWSNALDLKSSVPQGTVGSNPTLSVEFVRPRIARITGKIIVLVRCWGFLGQNCLAFRWMIWGPHPGLSPLGVGLGILKAIAIDRGVVTVNREIMGEICFAK